MAKMNKGFKAFLAKKKGKVSPKGGKMMMKKKQMKKMMKGKGGY